MGEGGRRLSRQPRARGRAGYFDFGARRSELGGAAAGADRRLALSRVGAALWRPGPADQPRALRRCRRICAAAVDGGCRSGAAPRPATGWHASGCAALTSAPVIGGADTGDGRCATCFACRSIWPAPRRGTSPGSMVDAPPSRAVCPGAGAGARQAPAGAGHRRCHGSSFRAADDCATAAPAGGRSALASADRGDAGPKVPRGPAVGGTGSRSLRRAMAISDRGCGARSPMPRPGRWC